MSYLIENNSTGLLTVQSSGLNTITTISSGVTASFTCILITGTTAASWDYKQVGFANGITYDGYKNRLINPAMAVDQRNSGAAQTFTAGAALAYSVDRWYGYCTGANVTGQQIAGTFASSQYLYQFTGAASVTAIGFAQRIEAKNCYDLANATVTLSAFISNSLLTSVTCTAYYANTADTFGTLATPTRTLIDTVTFTVSATRTKYTTTITLPSAATTGIEIVFTVGAQTSGTWIIDSVQLEKNNIATSFDYRPYGTELALCQRYFCSSFNIGTAPAQNAGGGMIGKGTNGATAEPILCWQFPVSMRAAPTVTTYNPSAANNQWSAGTAPRVVTNSTSFASIDNTGNPVTAGTQSYINASALIEL
jgi:hypothetical protein